MPYKICTDILLFREHAGSPCHLGSSQQSLRTRWQSTPAVQHRHTQSRRYPASSADTSSLSAQSSGWSRVSVTIKHQIWCKLDGIMWLLLRSNKFIMWTFLIGSSTFQSCIYPVVLKRLSGSCYIRDSFLKLWKCRESNQRPKQRKKRVTSILYDAWLTSEFLSLPPPWYNSRAHCPLLQCLRTTSAILAGAHSYFVVSSFKWGKI